MRRAVAGLALLVLAAGCAQNLRAPPLETAHEPIESWARVLERHVDETGRVDFVALAQDRRDLDRYLAWIARAGPASTPQLYRGRNAVLAYHINAYNALAMRIVLEKGRPGELGFAQRVDFFFLTRVPVDGRLLSLYAYENDVIRRLSEPRVHFALNCMALGCPRLPREPFGAERLDTQLERETRRFFAAPKNLRVEHAMRTVYINELLQWYAEDFQAQTPSLVAYVNRYRAEPIPARYRVAFIPYDWTLNWQP